jgi:RNA polymerase sigma-70 factor (ECF subfamily)
MRDVLGFSAREVAESLDTTVASANSALQRARKTIDERFPEQSQQATLRSLGDQKLKGVVEGYMDAMTRGDVDAVVAMLTEDATIAMPPMATWYEGRDACAVFLRDFAFAKTWVAPRFEEGERRVRLLVTRANGQPAIAAYRLDDVAGRFTPYALQVLSLRADGAITDVTGFVTSEGFTRFGLPADLPA